MKCLIVDQMHEKTDQFFNEIGLEVEYQPDITRSEILDCIGGYEGMVIRSKTPVDKELIEKATKLRFIARAGAGVDNLDVELLEEKNIAIINAPEGNRNALAEQSVGMLLSLLHHIVKADKEVRKGAWHREANRGVELAGKTVGLLGYGYMGQAFAKKLSVFGCNVLAYDKYKVNCTDKYCRQTTLQEVFDESDIFSIHVPLTGETKQMVDKEFIDSFKKNIYLLNTSRGEVLSLAACCEALESGKLLGLALDVLENERLNELTDEQRKNFSYLSTSNKTILTPHVAGWSFESYENISRVLAAKIKAFLTQ
ncbi:phosphoglycerate dehydrogenase [Fulvivirga sp. RKSG066]|uniref:NAD(P)-dependent oxidoreductase n=1 Tax=Fulvivirga aurantia TaxID=2529383 RepID=UPI0012BB6C84|nr:NAD(P)-dependent oxidoreductase [Fulvivirga aurantia]MTI20858.1 phosphoglycerate dehydrogenase [Fulvivirga aurantia]